MDSHKVYRQKYMMVNFWRQPMTWKVKYAMKTFDLLTEIDFFPQHFKNGTFGEPCLLNTKIKENLDNWGKVQKMKPCYYWVYLFI